MLTKTGATLLTVLLIDPRDWYPLVFRTEFLDRTTKFIVRFIHVIVDDYLVEVLFVHTLYSQTLIVRVAEICFL